MRAPEDYDVIVLGAGTGGLGAARAARGARKRVALVEAERPGGDCTWYGCVPSKTIIETARAVHDANNGAERGIRGAVTVDFAAVMEHVRATRELISADESPALLRRQGIHLVRGRARFVEPAVLEIDADPDDEGGARRLRAGRFVLATGGTAVIPDVPGIAASGYLTNETIWELKEQPEHLLVLGGGPIGCELAQAFRRLGSRVTLVQSRDRLLARDEPEASEVVRSVLEREGVKVRLSAQLERVGAGPTLHLRGGARIAGSHLVVSAGRRPRTDGMGLDVAGVALDGKGRVDVDKHLRSRTAEHVWAVGDCAAALTFTHVADDQARVAVRNLLFADRPSRFSPPSTASLPAAWSDDHVPWVTFTDPEVAHVGMSESAAFERWGERARVALVPMSQMDRPRCAGRTEGFVKLVASPGPLGIKPLWRLVGMTAVGPTAGEMLHIGALAVRHGTPVARIATVTAAYPTWSIATRVAASLFFGGFAGLSARPARPVDAG